MLSTYYLNELCEKNVEVSIGDLFGITLKLIHPQFKRQKGWKSSCPSEIGGV